MSDRTPDIEQEVWIDAPVETVWSAISTAEHLAEWFSDEAVFEARPGAEGLLTWRGHGTFPLRVEEVDQPRLLTFRWLRKDGAVLDGPTTMVRFHLTEQRGGTLVHVIETGVRELPWTAGDRVEYARENSAGWRRELGELTAYVEDRLRTREP